VLSQLVKCDRERDICNTFNAIWDYDRKFPAEFGQSQSTGFIGEVLSNVQFKFAKRLLTSSL